MHTCTPSAARARARAHAHAHAHAHPHARACPVLVYPCLLPHVNITCTCSPSPTRSQDHWSDVVQHLEHPAPSAAAASGTWGANRGLSWQHVASSGQHLNPGNAGGRFSFVGKLSLGGGDRGALRHSFHRNGSSGLLAQGRSAGAGGGGASVWGPGGAQGAARASMSRRESPTLGQASGEQRPEFGSCGELSKQVAAAERGAQPDKQERPVRVGAAAAALLGFVGGALRRLPQFYPDLQVRRDACWR